MAVEFTYVRSLVEQVTEDVVHWRRYLHQNPELSFEEEKTSQFVYDTLASFGGLGLLRPTKTSVVARLKGSFPGPVLAIRADMDALPITEENNFDFASKTPGKMHACGHDGHTAMLLGTAKILSGLADKIHGEVRFIFQHAEELFPGGAQQMVDAGVMEGVDSVIGIHLWSPLEVGKIAVKIRPVDGGTGHILHHYSRQRRPRSPAACHGGPHRDCCASGDQPSTHCFSQYGPTGSPRIVRYTVPRWNCTQHHSGDCGVKRDGAFVQAGTSNGSAAPHGANCKGNHRGARSYIRVPLRTGLSPGYQRRGSD